jgi:uncharacterized protein Veg
MKKVYAMSKRIPAIRTSMKPMQGSMVHLYAIGDRNKVLDTEGVLQGVYRDIFTVRVASESYTKTYCYPYCDIITKNVQINPIMSG